jgi:2-isopropylmalate synthase
MQVEFSAVVQRQTDASETEMGAAQLWELFQATYLSAPSSPAVVCHSHRLDEDGQGIELDVSIEGVRQTLRGQGNGPIAATVDALGMPLRVDHYEERATGTGANAQALAIVEAAMDGVAGSTFGAGASHNIVTASVQAIVSVANRLAQRRPQAQPQVAQSA